MNILKLHEYLNILNKEIPSAIYCVASVDLIEQSTLSEILQ